MAHLILLSGLLVGVMKIVLDRSSSSVSAFAFTASVASCTGSGSRSSVLLRQQYPASASRGSLAFLSVPHVLRSQAHNRRLGCSGAFKHSVFATPGRRHTACRTAAASGSGITMAKEALILTEENVIAVLEEAKQELGTLFGNSAENKEVGITGDVEFVGLEGPSVVVRLTGRFWHSKAAVLERVANFILTRIPECVDVEIEDPSQMEDADPTGRGQGAEL